MNHACLTVEQGKEDAFVVAEESSESEFTDDARVQTII